MPYRILAFIALALAATPSVAQQTYRGYSGGCTPFALSLARVMLVCSGTPSAGAVDAALRGGAVRGVNPRIVGRNYQIPPWEITGVHSAGTDHRARYRVAAPVIAIGHRYFAMYPRNGATILIERRR